MSLSFTGKKRIRKNFGRIPEIVRMPNLIQVQKSSYESFLQKGIPHAERGERGLNGTFQSVFPVRDFSDRAVLEYVSFEFDPPKFDEEECRQRDITYAALTEKGTFIVNGTDRVIVSQMHRSPGVFFDHDKGKGHSSGKFLFSSRIIPYRGSWLDFEFDAKDILYARIDRRRKLPATTVLYALGMSKEQILEQYYDKLDFKRAKKQGGWTRPFTAENYRGAKLIRDLVDAKTGEVVAPSGRKLTARGAKKLAEGGGG